MKVNTRIFGEIDVEEEKIIHFDNGIIGFPEYKDFTLIFDVEKGPESSIIWLQSMDEAEFAIPVLKPQLIQKDYNPSMQEEYLEPLGDIHGENALMYVTVTIPAEIEKMSINLRAPIVINVDSRKAAQIIVEDDLPVKYYIYDIISSKSEEKEDE